jgi:ATP-binding cassette subfamily B protein
MDSSLCRYAVRPIAFVVRYLRRRLWSHVAILTLVLSAVICSVTTQYAVKFLVDTLAGEDGANASRAGNQVWPF